MSEIDSKEAMGTTRRLLSPDISVREKNKLIEKQPTKTESFADIFKRLCNTTGNKITVGKVEALLTGKGTISSYMKSSFIKGKNSKRNAKRSVIISIAFILRDLGATVTADDVNAMLACFNKHRLNTDTIVDRLTVGAFGLNKSYSDFIEYLYDKGFSVEDLNNRE